jgi:hypothetical protein
MVPAWPAPPAAADVLLFMNEAHAHRRWRRRRGNRQALEQRLARVAAELEHSEQHQASLQQVLKLGADFQSTLSEPQRARWLALEDALLDHAERSQRAYFLAGVELGQRALAPRGGEARSQRRDERVDALSMLARLILHISRR